MANVFYVREGRGNDRTSLGREIPLARIVDKYPAVKPIWSQYPPCLNSDHSTNPVADFRYVVLHLEYQEVAGKFDRCGYWLLNGVTPQDFENMFPI